MDIRTYMSNLSEAKILADLCSKGYHVFSQSGGKAPFDMVASRDDKLIRIQVKSVLNAKKSGHLIRLSTTHANKTKNTVKTFDSTKCDVLAVYMCDIDKIIYVDPKSLHGKHSFMVNASTPEDGSLVS